LSAAELPPTLSNLAAAAAIGVALSSAAIVRGFERGETRHIGFAQHKGSMLFTLSPAFAALLLSIITLLDGTFPGWVAALLGLATFGAVIAMRRLALSGWAQFAFETMLALAALGALAMHADEASANTPLTFALGSAPSPALQQVLRSIPWLGTGGGTFGDAVSIYGSSGQGTVTTAPSTILKSTVEFGALPTAGMILLGLLVVNRLFGAALIRGRDSFYPAAAAACVVMLAFQAFCDTTLFTPAIGALAAITIGLGVAQAVGRSPPVER
jgi:hypothetical protein